MSEPDPNRICEPCKKGNHDDCVIFTIKVGTCLCKNKKCNWLAKKE